MHQVITINNFAKIENNKIKSVNVNKSGTFEFEISTTQIEEDLKNNKLYYTMEITQIDDDGYVSKVTITKNR